jgi:hypothetical protein
MKNILLALLAAAVAATGAFAQEGTGSPEIKFGGEVKTGLYWREKQTAGDPPDTETLLHNMDDAGGEGDQGRFRLNIDYDNGKGFGIRLRINQQNFKEDIPKFPYAFGYGNFFDDQLTVAIGKLGGSPWGTGGPEMWKELETAAGGGMRVEWKPSFIPESGGKLNIGFVLNYYNGVREATGGTDERQTLLDILSESVIGVSFTHEYFLVRAAYRLDGPVDVRDRTIGDLIVEGNDLEGGEMVYRLEERFLRTLLPGFSIWALGYIEGVGATLPEVILAQNWLFAEYNPEMFTAQLRFGYDFVESRSVISLKPSFYWHFFDRMLTAGVSFSYAQDFGAGKKYEGSPFSAIELEPKVQLNFTSSYIAFVYNWKREYVQDSQAQNRNPGTDPIKQTQRMNLRFCIYY